VLERQKAAPLSQVLVLARQRPAPRAWALVLARRKAASWARALVPARRKPAPLAQVVVLARQQPAPWARVLVLARRQPAPWARVLELVLARRQPAPWARTQVLARQKPAPWSLVMVLARRLPAPGATALVLAQRLAAQTTELELTRVVPKKRALPLAQPLPPVVSVPHAKPRRTRALGLARRLALLARRTQARERQRRSDVLAQNSLEGVAQELPTPKLQFQGLSLTLRGKRQVGKARRLFPQESNATHPQRRPFLSAPRPAARSSLRLSALSPSQDTSCCLIGRCTTHAVQCRSLLQCSKLERPG